MAMTVASTFYFDFWSLWGVVLKCLFGCLLEAFVDPKASLGVFEGGHLGVLGVTFWGLWRSFWLLRRALEVLWASLGVPGTSLGVSGTISRIFREIPGGLLAPFWAHFCCFLAFSLGLVF